MRLVYDSVKPRRAELVIQQGDEFDVSDRIGDQLRTVTGFKTPEGDVPAAAAAKKPAAKKRAAKKSSA